MRWVVNRKYSCDSIPYVLMLLHWIHELCSINVDVEVGCLLLRETFTTEIYHVRFTSASDEKHTIIIYSCIYHQLLIETCHIIIR